jgi:hypothetical protein
MNWPNVHENPGPPAPGRYCLTVCYCGDCDHYEPIPPPRRRPATAARNRPTGDTWTTREAPTWIDQL